MDRGISCPRQNTDIHLYFCPYRLLVSSGSTVFGKPLRESLRYASVHISTSNAQGELYVWGYIPVVVAKWCVSNPISPLFPPLSPGLRITDTACITSACSGLYLKENGTCCLSPLPLITVTFETDIFRFPRHSYRSSGHFPSERVQ